MKDTKLQELIQRYIDGTATVTEQQELLNWYRSKDHTQVEWTDTEEVEDILDRVLLKTKQEIGVRVHSQTSRFKSFPWTRVAIAASILLALGIAWISHYHKVLKTEAPLVQTEITPGVDKAILKMHDGNSIDLETHHKGKIGSSLYTVSDGQLKLNDPEHTEDVTPKYTSLETPKGAQYHMTLPDGTKVILNAQSVIRFTLPFVGAQRKVSIEGEVYFDVAKDKNRPFIVTAQQSQIEVLGTQFNINAYDKNHLRASLLEGVIQLNTPKTKMKLVPGQVADIHNENGKIDLIKVDLNSELSWTKGYFDFKDTPIRNIMQQLARWYDIEVQYEGEMSDKEYSARILRRDNIKDILNKLEATQTIRFKTIGRKVIVMAP